MLADSLSDEFYGDNASSRSLLNMEIQPSSTPEYSGSYLTRVKAKINRLWLQTVRCWPSVLLLSPYIFHGICKFEARIY